MKLKNFITHLKVLMVPSDANTKRRLPMGTGWKVVYYSLNKE